MILQMDAGRRRFVQYDILVELYHQDDVAN